MANLILYRASAGSGKTYTLVKEFLIRALQDTPGAEAKHSWNPFAFSHILCLTFTRKATAEMKERIIRALYKLAKDEPQADYKDELCQSLSLKADELRSRAKRCLRVILHNYSALSVFTIDSFIQQIFDALIWELNLKPEQQETTNTQSMLTEAAAYLLQHLSTETEETKAVYEWCNNYIQNARVQTGSWHIEKKLVNRGFQLFSDDFVLLSHEERNTQYSLKNFQSMEEELSREQATILKEMEKLLKEIATKLDNEGITSNKLKGGKTRNGWETMRKLVEEEIERTKNKGSSISGQPLKLSSKTLQNWRTGPAAWIKDEEDQNTIEEKILPKYQELYRLILRYNTVLLAWLKLPELGLLNELRRALDNVERERGTLLLADLAYILHGIAEGNDASFIYERMGMRYHSLFIDEFQDTSRLHWEILKPFIDNAVAEGGTGLLVGDVKQAIYRWRGGDWELLAHEIPEKENKWEKDIRSLDTNYRSAKEIVEFNSKLLKAICDRIKEEYIGNFGALCSESDVQDIDKLIKEYQNKIDSIYSVTEKYRENAPNGYVEFTLYKEEDDTTGSQNTANSKEVDDITSSEDTADSKEVERTLEILNELRDKGMPLNQIALLVREGRTAQRYAEALASEAFEVVSQDAFILDKSQDVQVMLAALRIAISPSNKETRKESPDVLVLAQHFERLDYPNDEPSKHWTQERNGQYSDNLQKALQWLRSMASLPLLDLFDNIAYGLHLPTRASEMPYFSHLRDKVYAFHKGSVSGTYQFLSAYDEEDASKRAIDAPTNENAVNIMTIHKSKGLEFEVVICPEINFSLFKSDKDKTLWAKKVGLNDTTLPLLPHGNDQKHFASNFARNLLEEYYLSTVDTLNLIYVAFTRAKSQLYLIATEESEAEKTLSVKLSKYLTRALKETFAELTEDKGSENESVRKIYQYGKRPDVPQPHTPNNSKQLQPRDYNPDERLQRVHIKVRQVLDDSQQSFQEQLNRSHAATLGTQLHRLMMGINNINDLSSLSEYLIRNKMRTEKEAQDLVDILRTEMKGDTLAKCYAPEIEAWAERDFVDKRGRILRPDRIVRLEESTVVIDFKFGSPQEQHKTQIEHYKTLLRELNFPNPKGILWYIDIDHTKSQIVEC